MKGALRELLKAEWEFMMFCIRATAEVQEEFGEHRIEKDK